ncbi:uncharacterized protein LOC111700871 isoform X4 [Eurytemora carolleeae]|uniref:uncharacterized protein LOC111700871 isoform X4 n=1 Tax=Eurytemora carolleeae TaxID=1294199 RepID=UPI000C783163|nr:uncharacterized protein LOC111700871 isoform X4 [Eurytemora carolleeae]|eukprot:XP_023327701.1 uncharacterized protein LOC111700871 isoform X4 [Eurytemora affinis]
MGVWWDKVIKLIWIIFNLTISTGLLIISKGTSLFLISQLKMNNETVPICDLEMIGMLVHRIQTMGHWLAGVSIFTNKKNSGMKEASIPEHSPRANYHSSVKYQNSRKNNDHTAQSENKKVKRFPSKAALNQTTEEMKRKEEEPNDFRSSIHPQPHLALSSDTVDHANDTIHVYNVYDSIHNSESDGEMSSSSSSSADVKRVYTINNPTQEKKLKTDQIKRTKLSPTSSHKNSALEDFTTRC